MDYETQNPKQRHRRGKGWEFTFVGETPTKLEKQENRPRLASELNQSELGIKQVFPLSTTQVGDRVVVQQIQSERSMVYRLSNMGLALGSEVEVISKTTRGSVIICIQDEEIGLGAAMADRVMVTFAIENS